MAVIEWKDEYSIQIVSVDDQHKRLIEIINKFETAIKENKAKEIIGETLNSLVDYTNEHFADEEKIMEQCNYPEIENHKIIHRKLINEVGNCLIEFAQCTDYNTSELLLFLKEWLIDHIINEDKKIEKFIIKNNIPIPNKLLIKSV